MERYVFTYGQGWIKIAAETLRHKGNPERKFIPVCSNGQISAENSDASALDDPGAGNQREQC